LTTFIIIGALMVSFAIGLVAWPLWQGRSAEGRGTLVALALVVLVLPVGSALIYRSISTWRWDGTAGTVPGQHPLEESVAKLEAHLKEQPDDLDGWLLLGRSQYVTQHFQRASEAYGKAYALSGGKNLEATIGYAETLALLDQNAMRGKAGELFEDALKADPQNPKALFYGGVAAAANGRLPVARERWLTLVKQDLPGEVKTVLVERIRDLDRQAGHPDDPTLAQYLPAAAPAQAPGMMAAGAPAPSAGPPPKPAPGTVTVHVRVSPALAAKIPPGAPLFVLARDPTQPGPPFGAKRIPGAALPIDVQITEQDSMMADRTIKTAKQLVIVARFSASGMPTSASGDLYGEVPYDLKQGKTVDLLIDKQVP
jgi:cytochrome c-type biogenesis protein CcmH